MYVYGVFCVIMKSAIDLYALKANSFLIVFSCYTKTVLKGPFTCIITKKNVWGIWMDVPLVIQTYIKDGPRIYTHGLSLLTSLIILVRQIGISILIPKWAALGHKTYLNASGLKILMCPGKYYA